MITKEEYDNLNDRQKSNVVEAFAMSLEITTKKLMDGKKLPTYRKLKRYCLNVINKKEIKKEKL